MELQDLKVDELDIRVIPEEGALRLSWKGALHAHDPADFLEPYFDLLVRKAAEEACALVLDFTELEYMNSASIPPLIQLLRLCGEKQIKTEYVYDSARKVQTASFRALDVIARKSRYTSVKGI